MNQGKNCPQCSTAFEGRSNQIYCSTSCKQRAFQEGKTQSDSSVGISPTSAIRSAIKADPEIAMTYETLRLQSEERLRKMELDDRDRERRYESEKQERQFEQELELAQVTTQQEQSKWQVERQLLLQQLSGVNATDKDESEEGSPSPSSGLGWIFGILGGVILIKAMSNKSPTPNRQLSAGQKPFPKEL